MPYLRDPNVQGRWIIFKTFTQSTSHSPTFRIKNKEIFFFRLLYRKFKSPALLKI